MQFHKKFLLVGCWKIKSLLISRQMLNNNNTEYTKVYFLDYTKIFSTTALVSYFLKLFLLIGIITSFCCRTQNWYIFLNGTCVCVCVCARARAQSHLTLCDPIDYSLPGFFVHGIFQARILEWVAISFSKGSSWYWDWTQVCCVSCIGRQILYHWTTLISN